MSRHHSSLGSLIVLAVVVFVVWRLTRPATTSSSSKLSTRIGSALRSPGALRAPKVGGGIGRWMADHPLALFTANDDISGIPLDHGALGSRILPVNIPWFSPFVGGAAADPGRGWVWGLSDPNDVSAR